MIFIKFAAIFVHFKSCCVYYGKQIDMPVLMRAVSARDEGSLTRFLAMRAGALNLSLMNLNFEAISIGTIVTKLCKALTSNRTITSLNLEQVKYQHHQKPREADRRAYGRWDGHAYIIHNTSVIELAEALKHNTTITELNLKNHMIGPDGVNAIIEMLKVNSTIRSLQLSNNVMQYANDKITQLLVDAMRNRSAFTLLGIVGFKTSDSIISQLLAPDSKLLQLEVDVYARDDQRICNLLISNTSVTDLELGFVGGYHPESSLGKMISLNSTITSLNLSKNGLFDIGTTALAQAMKCNVSITSLILQHDKIQSEAAGCAIASLLTDNSRIVKRSNIWI
jgi:hypothetical protein